MHHVNFLKRWSTIKILLCFQDSHELSSDLQHIWCTLPFSTPRSAMWLQALLLPLMICFQMWQNTSIRRQARWNSLRLPSIFQKLLTRCGTNVLWPSFILTALLADNCTKFQLFLRIGRCRSSSRRPEVFYRKHINAQGPIDRFYPRSHSFPVVHINDLLNGQLAWFANSWCTPTIPHTSTPQSNQQLGTNNVNSWVILL